MTPRHLPKRNAGFSLIEVVVALGVLSTAAIALLMLSSSQTRTADALRTRTLGLIAADNLMVEAFLANAVSAGALSEGDYEVLRNRFHWRRTVADAGQLDLVVIEIALTDAAGHQAASLSMVRERAR